jgi:hypothetical protein
MSQWDNPLPRGQIYGSMAIAASFYDRSNGRALKKRRGTAFAVRGALGVYIFTNRHMVDYNYKLSDPADKNYAAHLNKVQFTGHYQLLENPAADTSKYVVWYNDPRFAFPNSDLIDAAMLTALDQPAEMLQERPSAMWALNHYSLDWLASTEQLDSALPGDSVFIAGYPALGELSSERPLLVSGIISSDPRYPANFIRESLPASVLCHSFSWGGMSGSPVLGLSQSIGKSKILGVNCGHIASQGVSGGVISYFARSDALIEMLSSTGESVPV